MWGEILGAGAGLLGSLFGGDSQADAAGEAARLQAEAEAKRLQFLKDQWKYAKTAYQPYRKQGTQADRALDNAYYGDGGRIRKMTRNNMLYKMADDQFRDANAEGERAYGEEYGLAGDERNTLTGNNEQDFATRKSYTDKAVADRAALNAIYQGENTDRIASMFGVTGQAGKLQRAADENSNRLNLEFAGTERGWRNEDYDPYATNRMGIDQSYYGNVRDAQGRKNNYRKSNIDTRYAGRAAAYGDATNFLQGRSQRGYNATGGAVTAGQNFAQGAGDSAVNSGNAYAQGLLNKANAYGNMWDNVAGFGGEIVGALSKNKAASKPNAYAYG